MEIIERIAKFHDELKEWRHDIHAHPELGFEEQRTSDLVAQKLAGFGCEVFRASRFQLRLGRGIFASQLLDQLKKARIIARLVQC